MLQKLHQRFATFMSIKSFQLNLHHLIFMVFCGTALIGKYKIYYILDPNATSHANQHEREGYNMCK